MHASSIGTPLAMHFASPFAWMPKDWRLAFCVLLAVATFVVGRAVAKQGLGLEELVSNGILAVEAPWSPARAAEVRAALGRAGVEAARYQTYYDFAFLLLYPLAISTACALTAEGIVGKTGSIGMMISWAVLLAMPLDALENVCMLRQLAGATHSPWPQLSTSCAAVKFALVFGGVGFFVTALVTRAMKFAGGLI